MSIILDLIMITIFLWVVPSAILYNSRRYEYNSIKEGRILRERTMTNYNFLALLFNIKDGHFAESVESFFKRDWKPKTGIDKEIAEEENEIAELERQKEKMDRLAELKRRKKMLFEEVQESEVEREEVLVICDSCGNYMDYLGIDRSRREVYECKDCNHTLKAPLCTN